ncbi:MAG: DDE-type integrase/transposase/recombinase [Cyanobacteria bacterium REEB67]|nr:DDE-type integrase/transposase/recombinase [Cyanobacteria bacterium REEB67]
MKEQLLQDDSDSLNEKYLLIAPCIEQGMSLLQRSKETGVHRNTLGRLKRRFENGGMTALERTARADKDSHEVTPIVSEIIRAHLIVMHHQSVKTVQRLVTRICEKQDWQPPTYWTVYRIKQKIPKDLLALSKNRAEYKRLYELVHRFEASTPNELWQADHNFMDILVWDENGNAIKPVLTVILDDYSRAVAGYFIDFSPPSAQRTATALRRAIWHKPEPKWLVCGIPDKLYTDRGADFVSRRLHQISVELDFELIKGRPYHPQGKGKIERFFETMNQKFLCQLDGYTPENKAPQKPGLTLDQLKKAFHDWLVNEYMQEKNEEIGESPFVRWTKMLQVPRMPKSVDELHLLLMCVSDSRKVHPSGIKINTFRYISTELQNGYVSESVQVRFDPIDLSKIFVFHKDVFICEAECKELNGKQYTVSEIMVARASRRKELNAQISSSKKLVETYSGLAARLPTSPQPTPGTTQPMVTPSTIKRYTVDE